MKFALQIYGQLRTFEKTLPTLLNFIDYYNNDYDVFLFIDPNESDNKCEGLLHDKCPVSNYSEENIIKLKKILIEDRIKILKYTTEMSADEISYDTKQSNDMVNLWRKYNSKYGNIVLSYFAASLAYRKYLLNNIRINYENLNNIKYDYIVHTRFDFGTTYKNKYTINETTTPVLFSDCIAIGNTEFINKNAEIGLYYPVTPKILFDENCNLIHEKINKYENFRGDKFWEKHWIFMPELNQRLYLLENSYNYIDAWWETPCNYGFTTFTMEDAFLLL